MGFQKSQPARAVTYVPIFASTGPLKNMDASTPARKAHAHEMDEKAGSTSNTCELPWPARGDMKKRLPTKPLCFQTAPRVQRRFTRMRVIMAAANCSPAIAYRRAKYDGDFRVPTLSGA
jgi:hypothetical protein